LRRLGDKSEDPLHPGDKFLPRVPVTAKKDDPPGGSLPEEPLKEGELIGFKTYPEGFPNRTKKFRSQDRLPCTVYQSEKIRYDNTK
jgi:hypothetical protein